MTNSLKEELESSIYKNSIEVLKLLNKHKNGTIVHGGDDEMTERIIDAKSFLFLPFISVEKYIKIYNNGEIQAVIEFVSKEEGYSILKENNNGRIS